MEKTRIIRCLPSYKQTETLHQYKMFTVYIELLTCKYHYAIVKKKYLFFTDARAWR